MGGIEQCGRGLVVMVDWNKEGLFAWACWQKEVKVSVGNEANVSEI